MREIKINRRKWARRLEQEIGSGNKRVHLITELVNFVIWFGKKSYWEAECIEDALIDLDKDLQEYFEELSEEEQVSIDESVMQLVAIALGGQEDVAILHRYGKVALIGNKQAIQEVFEGTDASYYDFNEEFWF